MQGRETIQSSGTSARVVSHPEVEYLDVGVWANDGIRSSGTPTSLASRLKVEGVRRRGVRTERRTVAKLGDVVNFFIGWGLYTNLCVATRSNLSLCHGPLDLRPPVLGLASHEPCAPQRAAKHELDHIQAQRIAKHLTHLRLADTRLPCCRW
jgi:hypothetical protein